MQQTQTWNFGKIVRNLIEHINEFYILLKAPECHIIMKRNRTPGA